MKKLKRCFGTKKLDKLDACKRCQFHKKCEKEQRTDYQPLESKPHPKYPRKDEFTKGTEVIKNGKKKN